MTLFSGFAARLGRYLSVGAICAVVYNVIMIGGDRLHVHYAISFIVVFCVVTPLGYVLHVFYTFGAHLSWRGFARFVGANLVGAQISLALTALFCSGFGLSVSITAPIVTLCLFVWNYTATHWAIVARVARRGSARASQG